VVSYEKCHRIGRMQLKMLFVLTWTIASSTPALAAQTVQQRVDQVFVAYKKSTTPGCALGVIRDGTFVYRKAYGTASLELRVPLSAQSVFYMGSVSKQFTAASVVLAAEQGLLALDDDIRKYIPELPNYGETVTLRQMLHHTSGFRDFLDLLELSGRSIQDKHSSDELIDLIARQKALNFKPGAEYLYSNTNYFLLAVVISRITKKPFSEFAAENIFRPLGMTHTRFYDDRTVVVPDRVPAYGPGSNGGFQVGWSTNYDIVGSGGLMSSVNDLLPWDQNFYKNRLGDTSFLREMETRGVLNDGSQINYALGLEVGSYRGLSVVEHNGALMGYRTEILRFPEQRFTVVCLCNLANADPTALAHQVADIYLEKSLQPIAAEPESVGYADDISRFAGKYFNPVSHASISFAAAGDHLAWGRRPLRRIGDSRFQRLDGPIFDFDDTGETMRVTGSYENRTILVANKLAAISVAERELADYAGTYESTELGATYQLGVDAGQLTLRNRWNPKLTLAPLVRDEFDTGGIGTLVFRRDANGRITGLGLFDDRIRNVVFDKIR
jgi:CubicO group peptidase (beta-lactamase class C family)